MNFAEKSLLIFTVALVLDFVWAQYIESVAKKKVELAVISSVGIYFLGGISAVLYVTNPWLLIPAALGSGLGTYISVRRGLQSRDDIA